MAHQEHSVGQLYWVRVEVDQRWAFDKVEILQMHEPWRRGKALLFSIWPYRALVVGRWTRTIYEDIDEDFADDLWLKPQWLDTVTPDEISTWDDLSDPSEQETGEAI